MEIDQRPHQCARSGPIVDGPLVGIELSKADANPIALIPVF
jgi:hypothetical protein